MNQVNGKIKNLFAVLSVVTMLMLAFCVQGFAADGEVKYTVGVGETVLLGDFDSKEGYTFDPELVDFSSNSVTALTVGETTITYTDINQNRQTVLLTIKKAPGSVKLNADKVTLGVGESFKFKASINEDEACRSYKFSTDKPDVLSYSKGGVFTAKKTGTATVTVTTYNGKKATCKVTVKKAPTSVKLNATDITIGVGEAFDFNSSFGKGEACLTCKYTTNKPDILVYSKKGIFTAKKTGTATVIVTTYNGKKATCKVTVKKAPTSVKLNATDITIGVGEAFDFNSSFGKGEACITCKYTTNKPDILVYSKKGIFTAKKTGAATVTVTTYNGKKATCKVTVKKAPTSVKLNATDITIGVGEAFDFNSSFGKGEACITCKYTTNKPDILVYSKKGIFTAKKTGTATVTVTTYNGKKATCKVTVKKAPTSVKLNATSLTLGVSEAFDFNSSVGKNEACRNYKYTTNKPDVLAYSKKGIFTAKKKGTATVTVTTYNGKKATCKVTVLPLPKSITAPKSYYSVPIGRIQKIKVIVPNGYACNTFTYKSSAPSVVSVNSKGQFHALKVGSANITIKSKNGKTDYFTVYVNPMSVAFVNQNPEYPTGCEAASAVQLLRYYGYSVTLDQMVRAIPRENIVYRNGRRYGPDINKKFVGNPSGTYTSGNPGYGAFSPVVTKSLQKIIDERNGSHKAVKITGCTFNELLGHISNGQPAIVWATYNMNKPQSVNSWYIPQANGTARYFEYPRGTHVMVLTGWSDDYVWITDPILGRVYYSISTFKARWNLLGKQAIVLEKK